MRKSISNTELEVIRQTYGFDRLSRTITSKPEEILQSLAPCVYHFVQNTNRIVWYNVEQECWLEFAVPNHIFLKDSAWSLCEGGKLMNTGGYEFQAKDTVYVIDLDSRKEEKCQNMPRKRFKHAQVSLGSYVYVVGGVGKKAAIKSVHRYNLYSKRWSKIGKLSCMREYPGACSHEGKIYIAGGVGSQSIEVFNPLSQRFSLINIKISSPGRCCAFSYDDYIIILRGDTLAKFVPKEENSVELGKVLDSDWMISGEPYITRDCCYFYYLQELLCLDICSNSIKLIGQIP